MSSPDSTPPQKIKLDTKEWVSTFKLISWWDVDRVKSANIMVVGAGALGNEVLKNLALLNVGNILIVDFDTIEYGNLSRSVLFREADCGKPKSTVAAEQVRAINPNVSVLEVNGDIMLDIGLGVFRRMDVVIGCLDNRLARMYINRHCYKVGKIWIDGAIENLAGQLCVYQPDVSCYECQIQEQEWENIRYRMGCPDIAQRNANFGKIATTPISSSIIGAMQVQEALKVLHHNEKQLTSGRRYYYEGMHNLSEWFSVSELKDDCMSHFSYDPIIEVPELSCQLTIGEVLEWLSSRFSHDHPVIQLDHEVIYEITTSKSETVHEIVMAQPHFSDAVMQHYLTSPDEKVIISQSTHEIDRNFPHQTHKLTKIGIPPLQILRVRIDNDIHFVELTGDKEFLSFT